MDIVINTTLFLIKFLVGVTAAAFSVFLSIQLFDKFTKNIEEWKEIKKGNSAVGVFIFAVVLANSIIIEGGVNQIVNGIKPGMDMNTALMIFVINTFNLLISVVAAVIASFLSFWIFSKITIDLDEEKELKKGNLAIAFVLLGVFLATAFIIKGAVDGFVDIFNATEIIKMIHL